MFQCVECGDDIDPRRYKLGYKLCLFCGEEHAMNSRKSWCVANMNKSNYVLITDKDILKQLNPKRTT